MWGADCSRVTHPFAARVPRRALPLDLHVLSTPPAFVLSQDQTLQQNLAKQTRPQHGGLRPHISGTNHQTRKTKLDTLLSSQKTPTHHPPPLGTLRAVSCSAKTEQLSTRRWSSSRGQPAWP